MTTYKFHLITNKTDVFTDEQLFSLSDGLYEAGCDDATVAVTNGTLFLSFDREAEHFQDAVLSAIKDVESVFELRVISVDASDWVGLTDAAEMAGMTKSALSRYSKGTRGTGGFPCPKRKINSKNPLWRWAEIAEWLKQNGKANEELVKSAKFTETINLSLQLRDSEHYQKVMATLDKVNATN
ncbi:MAG: helix-turn-helix transcriptional regulator [Vibrio sp.]